MPNYSLVAGVTYDPLTYQEIAVPVKEAAAYHQALQDKYDELELNSAMYDAMIPKDDPEYALTRSMYDKYYSTLGSGADALTKNGGWGQNDVFSDVRKSFGRYMMPIAKAYARRTAEDDEQRKAKAANPFLEFSRDAKTSGLDYYINHPDGGYETMDTSKVASMTGTMAQQIQKQLRDPAFQESLKQLGVSNEYIALVSRFGATPEMINNWATDPILRPIVKRALNAQGMDIDDNGNPIGNGSFSKDQITKAISAGVSGLYMAIGEDKVQFQQNPEWLLNAELLKQQASAAAKSKDDYSGGRYNDHSWSLDDSMTDAGAVDDAKKLASSLGFSVDDNNNVTNPDGVLRSSRYGFDITDSNGNIRSMKDLRKDEKSRGPLPYIATAALKNPLLAPLATVALGDPSISSHIDGKNGVDLIQQLATQAGWRYDPNTGYYYVGNRRATKEDLRAAAQNNIVVNTASYHTNQDITLASGYNDSFKNQKVYHVSGFLKNGSYKTDKDKPTTIASILNDKNVKSVRVGASMTASNSGITLEVTKDDGIHYYFINAADIRDQNMRETFEELKRRAQARSTATSSSPYDWALANENYDNGVLLMQNSIGGSNSVSSTNINGN